MIELVGVEEIAGPSSREHEKHLPVAEKLENLHTLSGHIGVQHISAPSITEFGKNEIIILDSK